VPDEPSPQGGDRRARNGSLWNLGDGGRPGLDRFDGRRHRCPVNRREAALVGLIGQHHDIGRPRPDDVVNLAARVFRRLDGTLPQEAAAAERSLTEGKDRTRRQIRVRP
jgi:hypothetical protein